MFHKWEQINHLEQSRESSDGILQCLCPWRKRLEEEWRQQRPPSPERKWKTLGREAIRRRTRGVPCSGRIPLGSAEKRAADHRQGHLLRRQSWR